MGGVINFLSVCFIVSVTLVFIFISSKISVYGWHRPWTWWHERSLIYINKGFFHTLLLDPYTFYRFIYSTEVRCWKLGIDRFVDEIELAAAMCKHKKIPAWIDGVCTKEQYDRFLESGES